MGTETPRRRSYNALCQPYVKLNNPLMGTETPLMLDNCYSLTYRIS